MWVFCCKHVINHQSSSHVRGHVAQMPLPVETKLHNFLLQNHHVNLSKAMTSALVVMHVVLNRSHGAILQALMHVNSRRQIA